MTSAKTRSLLVVGLLIAYLTASGSSAVAAPTRYEAESATISQGTVASDHAGFSGSGFVDFTNVAGSYVEWTVNSPVAGTATLTIGYANGTTTNRPMDVTVNGTLVAGGLAFNGTGAWTTWQTKSITAPIPAGVSRVRATATTANGGPNTDYLDVDVVATPANEYQAEQATISQGVVEANHAGYTGSGFVNLDNITGSYLQWTVSAAATGSNNLVVRFANGTTTNRPMDVTVNGVLIANDLVFGSTGTWDTWQNVTIPASLKAGTNTVRLTSATANGGPNLDRLTVNPAPTPSPSPSPSPTPPGNVITVSSIAQLQAAANTAVPGTRIELTDGSYSVSSAIRLTTSGTPTAPITIAAQHVGGAEIKGSAGFAFAGVSYVVVSGFRLTHSGGTTIPGDSHHVRFSRNVIQGAGSATGPWVTVAADDSEIDHNTFQNKSTEGVFLQITGAGASDMAQRTWVHHNYFFNHTFSGSNGGESIRLGFSYRQSSSAFATLEYNLFEKANGDSEAISVKSSDNVIRYNTIRNSKGSIVLRHGNRNRVEGNIELGGSSGIRLYENDHVIISNLIQGGSGQIIVGSGTIKDDTNSTAHARVDRALVAFNTVVGSGTLLDVGPGSDQYGPDNCTFANNILLGGGSGGLVNVGKGTNLHWSGNIVWAGTGGDMPSSGYRSVNPALALDSGGLYRLANGSSPAVDTALGSYPQVVLDLDLQARTGAKDVGADEFVAGGTNRRALTTADVGPLGP